MRLVHTRRVPEGLEVEIYRQAAVRLTGRRLLRVTADDRVAPPVVAASIEGAVVVGVRRIGKLLLLDTDGPVVGVHFGMTGRIIVDGAAPIERLEYGSSRDDPRWHRFVAELEGGGSLCIADPRRWARVELDPDESRLGPDLLSIGPGQLEAACRTRRRAVKAVLLDQSLIAGLGNLCADEVLFTAGLHPARPAGELTVAELGALHDAIVTRLPQMLDDGGSHRGVLSPEVRAGLPSCPLDGAPLRRGRHAGRTTVWCSAHQTWSSA